MKPVHESRTRPAPAPGDIPISSQARALVEAERRLREREADRSGRPVSPEQAAAARILATLPREEPAACRARLLALAAEVSRAWRAGR